MKRYFDTFWIRLMLVVTLSVICAWLINERNWLCLCVDLTALGWSVWGFHRLYIQNLRKVTFLLDAIENDDSAIHFSEKLPENEVSQVNVMLNRIAEILQNAKYETIQREKYYELILNFVETGIVVVDENGAVFQKNRKALKLLGMEVFTHVKQLGRISEAMEKAFREILPGQNMKVDFLM